MTTKNNMIFCNFKSNLTNTYADNQETLNKYLNYLKIKYEDFLSLGYEVTEVDKIFYDPGGMIINTFPIITIDIFKLSLQHYLDFYEALDDIEYHSSGVLRGYGWVSNFIISKEIYTRVVKELKSKLGQLTLEYNEWFERWKNAKSQLPTK